MFCPNIFLSLREATKQSQSRQSNLMHPKERYIWTQVRILHRTGNSALVDNGMKIWVPKSRIDTIRLRNNTFEIYVQRKHCWIVLRTLFRMFYSNSYGSNF